MNTSINITHVRNIQRFNKIFFKVRRGRLFCHSAMLQNQCNEMGRHLQGEGPTAAFTRSRKTECSELLWIRNVRKNLLDCGKEYKDVSHKVELEISERPACKCAGKCFGNVKVEGRKKIKNGFYYQITRGFILPFLKASEKLYRFLMKVRKEKRSPVKLSLVLVKLPVEGSCEHGKKPSDSIKCWEGLE
jgi:hypothetical protein